MNLARVLMKCTFMNDELLCFKIKTDTVVRKIQS